MKTSTRFLTFLLGPVAALLLSSCATPEQTAALAIGGVAVMGSRSPAQELEQIYYVGVFDPEEQIQPTVYRLTVRGQASLLSATRFASGWVQSGLIDSLNGSLNLDASGSSDIEFSRGSTNYNVNLNPGRRMMMFGPEGFREAPANHRLVIVMGANPKGFFEAVDGALGEISNVTVERNNTALERKLFEALVTTTSSRDNLNRLKTDVAADLPRQSP